MINFIIYENDKRYVDQYVSLILKIIGNTNMAYKIIKFSKYDKDIFKKINKIDGNKIYILGIDVPGKSGLDLAHDIRNSGDWDSQIIMVTIHDKLKEVALTSRLLILDYISKYFNMEDDLIVSIKLAISILNKNKSLICKLNSETIRIPYDDILYMETSEYNSYVNIITKNNVVESNILIGTAERVLDDNRFFRSHKSYIVNINNIRKIDFDKNVVLFDNKKSALLSRRKKNELRQTVKNFKLSV